MKYYLIFIIIGLFGGALGSKKLKCEPFTSEFQAFNEAMLSLLNDIREYTKSNPSDPALASTHALSLTCEANSAIEFAAKAISRLSGVDSDDLINILNSTEIESFETPLDCVETDLIELRDQLLNIRDVMAPAVGAKEVPLEAPIGVCLGVLTRINSFIPNAIGMVSTKAVIIERESADFAAIDMSDLYQEFLRSICIWDIIESALTSLVATDASPAIEYINGESDTLPYPFTCFHLFIEFLKNGFKQQLDLIFDGTLAALTIPEMS